MIIKPIYYAQLNPKPLPIPIIEGSLACGFPIPSESMVERQLDLTAYLVKRPAATFFARAQGDSLKYKGILDGSLLVIDRSVRARQGSIVIACINAEYTCKILDIDNRRLLSANDEFDPIEIPEDLDLILEGVVIHSVNHFDWN